MAGFSSVGTKVAAKYFRRRCPLKNATRDEDCLDCTYSDCYNQMEEMAYYIDDELKKRSAVKEKI